MNCAITHLDSDGIISLALILRVKNIERAYFSSPTQLKDTICYSILSHENLDEIIITDITGSRESIILSSVYKKALWLDHHEWPEFDFKVPENVCIIVDKGKKSAARVVAEYFGIDSKLIEYADEIDTNSVQHDEARMIRNILGGIRLKFHGHELREELLKFAEELSREEFHLIEEKYRDIEKEYIEYVEKIAEDVRNNTRKYEINKLKVGIYETTQNIPVYIAADEVEEDRYDIFVVMIYGINKKGKPYTKLEFRTHTNTDVLRIARFFGGGGHLLASGATVQDVVTVIDILNAISELYP